MIESTTENFVHLVNQVKVAHRLCAGFYQRLLPTIKHVASELDFTFWSWRPLETERPPRATTQPAEKWAWDFLPLFASEHIYRRSDGDVAKVGDVAIIFSIYLDESFKKENRSKLGIAGQPDPIVLPMGEAVVEMSLYRCDQDNGESFDSQWTGLGWPDKCIEGWQKVSDLMSTMYLRHTLVEFIANPDTVVDKLRLRLAEAQVAALDR
ncbi:hypothetical protein [Polaromonas hydrogenivorans]|uniref:Uncharacterized protein n=1 Tax=Polaromonas hydrogenivorans TaxID=335476 RepID=A0AAU7LX89_9BURK